MDLLTSEALVQQARAFLTGEGLSSGGETALAAKIARGVTPEVLKRGKPPKAQTGRQQGDPELTEPDSDDDSLFGDDPPECAQMEAHDPPKTADMLSTEELIQRRLANVKALFSSYKVEYWALLEELRTRHERFRTQQPRGANKSPSGDSAPPKLTSEDDSANVRQLAKKQKNSHPSEDPEASGSGPPVSAIFAPSPPQLLAGAPAGTAGGSLETVHGEGPSAPSTSPTDPAQAQPSSRSVDVRGYGSDEDPVTFSDAEAVVLRTQDQPGAASKEKIRGWRTDFCRQLPHLTRLEQAATASSCRELDRMGAVACFCGRHNRFVLRSTAVVLGRATDTNQVDIDLSTEGDARKVSRLQAQLSLRPNGRFQLKNIGRRRVLVNNRKVDQGQVAQLSHLSLVEIGGARLLFMVNHAALKRASVRSTQLKTDF